MQLVIDLQKATNKTKTKAKQKSKLPPGGVWRTVRGAKVYIADGKIVAGADGKLSDFDATEIGAIYEARQKRKTYDQLIFEGTEVRIGKKRKVGKVVKETGSTYHIDFGDGKKPTIAKKKEVRRADAYKLKLEEKLSTEDIVQQVIDPTEKTEGQKFSERSVRKETGAIARTDEEFAEDMTARITPAKGLQTRLLLRDVYGVPMKEPLFDEEGKPVMDPLTGVQKEKFLTYEADDVTEEELIEDSVGMIITEVVNPFAKNIGLSYIQRQWRDEFGNPMDLYGDLVQTASVGFLYGVREFAYDMAQGKEPQVDAKTQGLVRARQQVSRQAQNIFSAVKLPEKLLAPLAIVSAIESRMHTELGRVPTPKEMVEGVGDIEGLKNNPVFASLKMREAPSYDQSKGDFVSGKVITDPVEKLESIYAAKKLQRALSLESTKLSDDSYWGDKDITLKDNIKDELSTVDAETLAKLEDEKKRAKTLKKEVKKLLGGILNEDELKLISLRFGIGLKKRDKTVVTMNELAEEMGVGVSKAKQISASAMKKLKNASPEQLDKIKQVYMEKSIQGLDILLKAIYVMDLQKSLDMFGLSLQDLDSYYIRSEVGAIDDIKKSLDTIEFIGSIVSIEGTDDIYATVIEYVLPDNLGEVMEKSQGVKKQIDAKDYIVKNKKRYQALAKKQRDDFIKKQHSGGSTSWSVQLLLDNPGSCWITWGGRRILINGSTGETVYDSAVRRYRDEYHPGEENPLYDYLTDYPADEIYSAIADEMKEKREKFKAPGGKKELKGFVKEWREEHKEDFKETTSSKITKLFPSGKFMLENPYTGKRVVVLVDIEGAGTKKATTKVIYAFDPDADTTINIGNWMAIWEQLYGDRFKRDKDGNIIEKDGEPQIVKGAWEYLMNDANIVGRHSVEVLEDKDYEELYGKTTEGMVEGMVHRNFRETTPSTMKVTEIDPKTKKFISVEKAYIGERIFKADIGGGRETEVRIKEDGTLKDPILQKLIDPNFVIRDGNDLGKAFKDAIGNEVWVTVGSSDTGRLNHHVKLQYDGKGAPVVVGGAFAGYRFQDSSEVDDPYEKEKSLFKHGKVVRTGHQKAAQTEIPFEVGAEVKIKHPTDKRKWIDAEIVKTGAFGRDWVVKIPDSLVDRGVVFSDGSNIRTLSPKDMKKKMTRLSIATEAPVIDKSYGDMLSLTVPEKYRDDFEANYGVELDADGRARISLSQFMDIRDDVGSFSLTEKAKGFVEDYYKKMQRSGMMDMDKLRDKFDPNKIDGFKDSSFLKKTNFYTSQLEGMEFLTDVGRGMAGHGMGTGKTILGVGASLYMRDKAIKEGRKPGKTLVVAPAGIVGEWLKTIDRDTTLGAVVLTSEKDDGRKGRQVPFESYKNTKHDEQFVVMSYDQFMKNPAKFKAMAGQFENMIIDEVHNFKTANGARNRALKDVSGSFNNLWGLSGTVMDNEVTDAYHLIDAVTGGKHDLGSNTEFNKNYLLKEGNKIVGMNESKLGELGKKTSKYVQFRDGYNDSIYYVDAKTGEAKKVQFPDVVGATNKHYGKVAPLFDYEVVHVETGKKDPLGKPVTRPVNMPKPKTAIEKAVYKKYAELEKRYLSEQQKQAMIEMEEAGIETGSKSYLKGVHVLQQFLNAPMSEQAFYKTDSKTDMKNYPFIKDKEGNKRYYKAIKDKNGNVTGFEKDPSGKPVLLPPMHHLNPKADGLRKHIMEKLEAHDKENQRRVEANKKLAPGQKPFPTGKAFPPKIVISSGYTTFGTDVIENVVREISNSRNYSYGTFTGGGGTEREASKKKFLEDPDTAFMIISSAGKEGISFSNGKDLIHYDHGFNPHKSAQISARIIRSSNWKNAEKEMRANEVNLTTISLPGTIEDVVLRTHDRKMELMAGAEREARKSEGQVVTSDYISPRHGERKMWVGKTEKKVKKSLPLVITF